MIFYVVDSMACPDTFSSPPWMPDSCFKISYSTEMPSFRTTYESCRAEKAHVYTPESFTELLALGDEM